MKTAMLCVPFALGLASCVVVNVDRPGSESRQVQSVRGALSGQRQMLDSFYATASDCTSVGYPTLKVKTAPRHGAVAIERGTAVANFSKDDVRSVCNGQGVAATVIYYTSQSGFVGEDSVAFERIGVRGAYGQHAYTIHVR